MTEHRAPKPLTWGSADGCCGGTVPSTVAPETRARHKTKGRQLLHGGLCCFPPTLHPINKGRRLDDGGCPQNRQNWQARFSSRTRACCINLRSTGTPLLSSTHERSHVCHTRVHTSNTPSAVHPLSARARPPPIYPLCHQTYTPPAGGTPSKLNCGVPVTPPPQTRRRQPSRL